jgi:hypothetical protein
MAEDVNMARGKRDLRLSGIAAEQLVDQRR